MLYGRILLLGRHLLLLLRRYPVMYNQLRVVIAAASSVPTATRIQERSLLALLFGAVQLVELVL
jgi:hypothetical protein